MAGGGRRSVPSEALVTSRRRMDTLPRRRPDRARMVEHAAGLYGVSPVTLYRQLRALHRPRPVRRADRWPTMQGHDGRAEAMVRTTNKKGRHLSTGRAIELLERHGVETPEGLIKLPPGALTLQTADRYLQQWGYDQVRMTRAPPAVRFQARRSNELWRWHVSLRGDPTWHMT